MLPLGDPRLHVKCAPVGDVRDARHRRDAARLAAELGAFRRKHGFGRAIAAPQIGVLKRFIAIRLDGRTRIMVNPRITWRSRRTFTMWDDCMCFPWLLVRVRRHASISVIYVDEVGKRRELAKLDEAASELLQHELDHLDGVLATQRAIDARSFVSRQAFEADRRSFERRVDYAIAGVSLDSLLRRITPQNVHGEAWPKGRRGKERI